MSLLVALAGTEGQFQFPLLMSVCLSACVHFGVFMFAFCCWGFPGFFVFVFFFFVCFVLFSGCFFFLNKEKMCIFLARTET